MRIRKTNSFIASFMLAFISCTAIASCNQEAFSVIKDSIESSENLESNSYKTSKIEKVSRQLFPLKKRSEKEIQEMLHLLPNELQVYIMRVDIGGDTYNAYVGIGSSYNNDFGIYVELPYYNQIDSINENNILYVSDYEIGFNFGRLEIKGRLQSVEDSKFSGMEFIAKTCDTCSLHEVDFISGIFETTKNIKGKNISYTRKISLPSIPENNKIPKPIRERINAALHTLGDKQTISKRLLKKAKSSFIDKNKMPFSLEFNSEYIDSVDLGYVSQDLLMFVENYYFYEGGAHGDTFFKTRAFSLQSGEELPTKIESILDMQKQDEILELLKQKLQPKIDKLYSPTLYIMPDAFIFDDSGIIFMWQAYSIAPYSSGRILVYVDFDELAPFLKKDSVYNFFFLKKYRDYRI